MYPYDIQLVLAGVLTAYLVFRCCCVCRERRAPPRLYRRLGDDDDRPVEDIVISDSTCRAPQRSETPPPSPWFPHFDSARPPRAPASFPGPAVHGAARAPSYSSGGPPPPYSRAANDAHNRDEPPPTYQQAVGPPAT